MKTKSILPVIVLFFVLLRVGFSQQNGQDENMESWETWLGRTANIHDDFDDEKSLSKWKNFAIVEGWPDRVAKLEIDKKAGSLIFEPKVGAWFWGGHGAFIYREIKGDFMAIARIKIRGRNAETPSVMWSRGGLLLREPPDLSIDKLDRTENFLHIMRVEDPDQSAIYTSLNEVKNEENATSQSSYVQLFDKYSYRFKLDQQSPKPDISIWVEIGIVRIDNALFTISRYAGQKWVLRRQNYRSLFSDKVQIGLTSVSVALKEDKSWIFQSISTKEYNSVIQPTAYGPDVVMEVDYFSVIKPEFTANEKTILTSKNTDEDREEPTPKEVIEKIINRVLSH